MSEQKIKPQVKNANRHTQRGMQALETSIASDGWIGAITVAADGETFDGSARVEKTAENGMLDEAIIIESDGTKPIVVKRTDIPTATDPRAVRLGLAANRIASLNLSWEPDILAGIAADMDLSGLFYANELAEFAQPGEPIDPAELWKGMPEFEHEDQTADAAFTIRVFLKDADDLAAFGRLLGKDLTGHKFVWFSKQPQGETYEAIE